MESERWDRVRSIFDIAVDLPGEEQRHAVDRLCGDDITLSQTVLELLQEDARQVSALDEDVDEALARMAQKALQSDHLRSLVQGQIGPYRLLRVLGEGGMGVVYLAERTDIGGQVAIKLLRDPWLSPMRRERFHLEQQALVKLNHPAIARIYDASTMDDGTPWFVMEYADGHPVTEYLRDRNASIREDLELFLRVCEAVQHAHALAIIHRDLKPSNILATAAGEVKLLDFGIAKQLDPDGRDSERTIAGLRLLTPDYAAPEQIEGGAVGIFTDVYSLGVLLYEILTGRLPRVGTDPHQQIVKPSVVAGMNEALRTRTRLSKQEWSDLDVLCSTALQVEPEHRYRSVDAIIVDITAYLEGRVLQAKPISFAYMAGKFVRRNRTVLAGLTLAVLLFAAASIIFTVRLAHARDAAVAEANRTKRIQRFMLDTLGNADEEAGPSSELKVVELLDREVKQVDALRADPETQLQLEQTLGSMYDRLGKYEKSQALLTQALDTSQRMGKENEAKAAAVLVQRGVLEGDRGENEAAAKDFEEAVHIARVKRLPANDPVIVAAAIGQARVYVQVGSYQKAIDLLTPVAQAPGNPYDVRDAVATLAVAELEAHHYEAANTASLRAIQLDRQLLGGSHVQTAVDLTNLASLKLTEGKSAEAEQLYREGSGLMQAWYGPDHPDAATSMGLLALTMIANGKSAEAKPVLVRVLAIQEKAYGPEHNRVASTLTSLGTIAVNRGELKLAEKYLGRALSIFHAHLGDDDPHTAAARSTLGTVYLKERRYALAENTLRQSVEAIAKMPPGNNLIGASRARWGRALLALHRYPEAEEQLIAGDELMQAQRAPPHGEVRNVRSDLITLYLATHRTDKANEYKAEQGMYSP